MGDFSFGESLQNALDQFFQWLPNLVAALVILVVGWFVAKILAAAVRKGAEKLGLDRRYRDSRSLESVRRFLASPTRFLGGVTFWLVFLAFLSWSVNALGSDTVEGWLAAVWSYVPNVLAALAIFFVAVLVAGFVNAFAKRTMGDTSLGNVVATAGPILVMTIATFMILVQLQIAESIVVITYAAILGAVALGSALAFGLGGREVAGRMLEGAYREGQARKDEFKSDLDRGTSRGDEATGDGTTRIERRPEPTERR